MNNFKHKLIIVFLFLSSTIQATNYYIDASNGDDDNNGMSPATSWKTISKVITMSNNFQPGDSILFKKGEIWNGESFNISNHPSGTAENPITYSSYGSGAKPIINIHTIQNKVWTDEGNNLWSTFSQTGSRYFKNNVELLRAVDSTYLGLYGTGFYDACYDGCNQLKLYVYSFTNPAYNEYSWSPRSCTFSLRYANYINLLNLELQGGASSSLRLYNNKGWNIINCKIGKYGAGGIKLRNSSEILIDSCVLDSYFTVDISQLPVGTSDYTGCNDGIIIRRGSSNITIRNCYFKNWEHASFGASTADSTGIIHDISFHNNELTSPDILHGGRIAYSGYVEDGEYYNNYIHNIRASNQLGGSRNHFHHNIIDSVLHSPIEYYVYANGVNISNYNVQVRDNIIENNVIANTHGIGMEIYSINFDYPGEMSGNIYRNNIIYNCGLLENNDLGIQIHKDSIGQLIYNNIIENNLIYSSNTSQTCQYQFNGLICDVATFNMQDVDFHNNIASNPLFVDPGNSDYHILANSPAIDAGTSPLSEFDYDGNIIPNGNAPDIGAFEYYASTQVINNSIKNIFIYPNPVKNKLYFTTELLNMDYKIISLTGLILKTGRLDKNEIDLTKLHSGLYFIEIKKKELYKKIVIKVIKE